MTYQDWFWSVAPTIKTSLFEPIFWQTWWFNILTSAGLVFIAYTISKIRINQIEETKYKQQEFARKLINTQEIERRRIAAELHDSIGQDLLIIKNRALLGFKQNPNNSFSSEQFEEISATATRALDETRAIARNLRPQHLQRFGLTKTLVSKIDEVENSSEIEFQKNIDEIDGLFSNDDELSIFRIIQECLNNIVKHSQANLAKIDIIRTDRLIKLKIQDFGVGFANQNDKTGFGLTSIEQRVKILGGTIKISSMIGTGTKITIFFNTPNERKSQNYDC